MAVDGFIQLAPDAVGKKVDTSELTRADATVVERQRVVLAGADTAELADILAAAPLGPEYGLVTRNLADPTKPELADVLLLLLAEARMLRQVIQNWTGQGDPLDLDTSPAIRQ